MWGRMFPPLILLLMLHMSHTCRRTEFECHNERCIPSGRYCDGNNDCGDVSDEPPLCTNCNRTLYAEANVKSPLHMSTTSLTCSITFVGGEEGRLQLNFLSLHIGALEKSNLSNPTCLSGHLLIEEAKQSGGQRTRGFDQLLSAFKEPTETLSSFFNRDSPRFGRICGDMVGRSATFFADSNNVTITAVPTTPSFTVYLTYKYLPSYSDEGDGYYGNRMTNTHCDRVFVNCDRKRCVIRSPNFPGFYLRNITCHYWIRQEAIPHGQHAKIVLSQTNEYKISLYTGRSGPGQVGSGLTEECHGDVMRVYDGNSTESPLLLEFCGAGTLTEVISSSSELLVQLYSSPNQVMHNSYAELDVEIRFTEASEYRAQNGRCDFVLEGTKHRNGLIYSPRHTIARNTTCSFRLRGASPHDRIWLYFLSYFVEDRHPWNRRETCEVGKLEINEPGGSRERAAPLVSGDVAENRPLDVLLYKFCEKNIPNVCARAADNPNYIPFRPCKVPDESYLSRGSELVVKHNIYTTPAFLTWSSSFTARYEFVDTRQHGNPSDPFCSRIFDSRVERVGAFNSPRNVFLFGRGGTKDVSCSYEFLGLTSERITLTFTDIRLKSNHCEHSYDSRLQRHGCSRTFENAAEVIRVTERAFENAQQSPLACFCGFKSDPRRPVVIQSVTNRLRIDFKVTDMTPYDDFDDFGFEVVYEFLPEMCADASIRRKNGSSEGQVLFDVPTTVEGRAIPLRCRWFLEAAPHKYLYLRFKGSNTEDCTDGNKIVVYSTHPDIYPISVVCVGENREVNVFSNYWYNNSRLLLRDQVYIEVLANHAETVSFEWLEVVKPSRTSNRCQHECPELNACIAAELWCDGRPHCPSGHDETDCQAFLLSYLIVGSAAALGIILTFVVFAAMRYRRRNELFKQSRPLPTEDFQIDISPPL